MSDQAKIVPGWAELRSRLCEAERGFYELEPGGALGLELPGEGWMLELTPDGRLICQTGIDMDDVKSLLSDGTPEDLGTDELAKQAKYYLQPSASKFRRALAEAGFEESTEMTDQYVAITFQRTVDLANLPTVLDRVQWCQQQFRKGQ